MSDDSSQSGRFIRPKDLDNAQRTTLGAQIGWRIEALAWDLLYWYPMKALPLTLLALLPSRRRSTFWITCGFLVAQVEF